MSTTPLQTPALHLVQDLRQIIQDARGRIAAQVNSELTLMYWHIGERINRDVLDNQCAEYGKQIVAAVSRQLQEEFGHKGFEPRNIRRMMQFAQQFPDFKIVTTIVVISYSDSYTYPNNASVKNKYKPTKYQTYEQTFTHHHCGTRIVDACPSTSPCQRASR